MDGPTLFAHKHAVQQVRAPLMNYSSASIGSVEVPDKSQALKWISRLTCLHRAGLWPLPQLYSPNSSPAPIPLLFPLVGDKCLTEAIRAGRALTDMWQCDTRPRHWWITLPHQSAMPPNAFINQARLSQERKQPHWFKSSMHGNLWITHWYILYLCMHQCDWYVEQKIGSFDKDKSTISD